MTYKRFDIAALHRALTADFETGLLVWNERDISVFGGKSGKQRSASWKRWNTRYSGQPAFFTQHNDGYLIGKIQDRIFRTHRVIWAMKYNRWPIEQLDHINGDRADNRISNLREVTNGENCHNQKMRVTNTSGHIGVYYDRRSGAWDASIYKDGVRIRIGHYAQKRDAVKARKAAEKEFGYHANHGVRQ